MHDCRTTWLNQAKLLLLLPSTILSNRTSSYSPYKSCWQWEWNKDFEIFGALKFYLKTDDDSLSADFPLSSILQLLWIAIITREYSANDSGFCKKYQPFENWILETQRVHLQAREGCSRTICNKYNRGNKWVADWVNVNKNLAGM